ncbi:MAG: ArsA family ATPase, partial [Deltaproteobacteria bacterium]|nr:ArsA family ATPase [Deltaproteobacteria bacterium]
PFVTKNDIQINRLADELVIRIGTVKRHILLPRQVMASKTIKAKLEGQELSIFFKGDEHERERDQNRKR